MYLGEDASRVVAAVRAAARRRSCYRRVAEAPGGSRLAITVRDHWAMLPTSMCAEVVRAGEVTVLSLSTRSQWFVIGDIFNCYNRMLDRFVADVRAHL